VQRAGKLTAACIVFLTAEPTLPPPMRSILIVSRSTSELAAVAQRLEQADYLVLTVEHLADAVESLTALVPGAILIDLPLSQARRLISQMRARPELRGIARLLVTGPLATSLPPVAASFPRPVEADHLMRALPALYPRAITTAAFQAPQPGQREERIQQALVHLLEPPVELPASAVVVAGPARAVAAVAATGGHNHRRRRRRVPPQLQGDAVAVP
jgi:CheY-like chemotaxis protein